VKYLIAVYDTLKSDLSNSTDWKFIKKFDSWEVYELLTHDGKYVVVPDYMPNIMETRNSDWKNTSLVWWMNPDKIDIPVVFVDNISQEDSKRFEVIKDLSELNAKKLDNNCSINETVLNEEVRFTTNCVGKPHIIKISYFPNWHVEGADKIYLVSPSFMLVYPEKENVRLFYGDTSITIIGKILTISGILIIFILLSRFSSGLLRYFRLA
jgi:hypothetical protein